MASAPSLLFLTLVLEVARTFCNRQRYALASVRPVDLPLICSLFSSHELSPGTPCRGYDLCDPCLSISQSNEGKRLRTHSLLPSARLIGCLCQCFVQVGAFQTAPWMGQRNCCGHPIQRGMWHMQEKLHVFHSGLLSQVSHNHERRSWSLTSDKCSWLLPCAVIDSADPVAVSDSSWCATRGIASHVFAASVRRTDGSAGSWCSSRAKPRRWSSSLWCGPRCFGSANLRCGRPVIWKEQCPRGNLSRTFTKGSWVDHTLRH